MLAENYLRTGMLPSQALDLSEGERAFIFAAILKAMEGGDA
ncbi:MAG: hypothetical protein ACLRM4_00625 [Anaerostipes sp.]|jgi:hypothetical protein|nr:MAG TPA: hypothetical protein [Caudoviricetes sp.]